MERNDKATLGVRFGEGARSWEIAAGYRTKPNARYFGIGPESRRCDESYFTLETSWCGAGYRQRVAGSLDVECAALFSGVGAFGPLDDSPGLSDMFIDESVAGYGERSDGVTGEFSLVHDNTSENGRPERGGLRRLTAG